MESNGVFFFGLSLVGSTPDGSFLQWFFSASNSALDLDENSQEIGWFVGQYKQHSTAILDGMVET